MKFGYHGSGLNAYLLFVFIQTFLFTLVEDLLVDKRHIAFATNAYSAHWKQIGIDAVGLHLRDSCQVSNDDIPRMFKRLGFGLCETHQIACNNPEHPRFTDGLFKSEVIESSFETYWASDDSALDSTSFSGSENQ